MAATRFVATVRTTPEDARARVYDFILRSGAAGVTDEDIFAAMRQGKTERAERHRRHALEQEGLIVDSGMRRFTSKGRKAVVWLAAASRRHRA